MRPRPGMKKNSGMALCSSLLKAPVTMPRNKTTGAPQAFRAGTACDVLTSAFDVEVRSMSGTLAHRTRLAITTTASELRAELIDAGIPGAGCSKLVLRTRHLTDTDVVFDAACAEGLFPDKKSHNDAGPIETVVVSLLRTFAFPRVPLVLEGREPLNLSKLSELNPTLTDNITARRCELEADHRFILASGEISVIVIDNGEYTVKAGLNYKDAPCVEIPPVVGRTAAEWLCDRECIGDAATSNHAVLDCHRTVDRGIVVDWDGMHTIWHHMFYSELAILPCEHLVLLSEGVLNPWQNRARSLQALFDLDVLGAFVVPAAVLAFYACCHQEDFAGMADDADDADGTYQRGLTGIVLDVGEKSSRAVPICQGYVLPHGIRSSPFGGHAATEHLSQLLTSRWDREGWSWIRDSNPRSLFEFARLWKESFCYVAQDIGQELMSGVPEARDFVGNFEITFTDERILCPEVLFRPCLLHATIADARILASAEAVIDPKALPQLVISSAGACRQLICSRSPEVPDVVAVAGGGAFAGLGSRLSREIMRCTGGSSVVTPRILEPAVRPQYAAWFGGAALASSPKFQPLWITKDEIGHQGIDVVQARCP